MRKCIILIVVLGFLAVNSFAQLMVFDAYKFGSQKLLNEVESFGWTNFLGKFQQAFDKFMEYRSSYLWPLEQMKPESFDLLSNLSDLKDLEKYFSEPFLKNSNKGEIWFDLFSSQATLVSRYQGLSSMGSEEQLNLISGTLEKDEKLMQYVKGNMKMEADHVTELEQLLKFVSDMRAWEAQRVDKMKEYVRVALEVTEAGRWKERLDSVKGTGESAGLMIHASTPKLKAVGASLELESLYLKIQQVALARARLETLLKEKTLTVDRKKRYQQMVDLGILQERKRE